MSSEQSPQNLPIAGLRAVLTLANDLTRCSEIDDIFLNAVQFAIHNLGLERCAIFVQEEDTICGTYGTNMQGEITDEHALKTPVSDLLRSQLTLLETTDIPWTKVESIWTEWKGQQNSEIGKGWVAITPIRYGEKRIGFLFNDRAISRGEVDPAQQELVSVFCSLLGSIIERKRSEDALAEERNLLRTLIDTVPDYIFAKDITGHFTVSNKAHALGANASKPEDLIGKTAADLYPPDLAAQFDADDRTILETGKPLVNVERTSRNLSRNLIHVSTTKAPLYNAHGKLIGLVGISRDITAQIQFQEALKKQQEYLRQIIDTVPAHIFIKDWNNNFILVNKSLAEFYDSTVEDMVEGHSRGFTITPEEEEHFVRDDREVITTLKPKFIPEESVSDVPTGRTRTIQTIKVPLRAADDSDWHVLGVSVDITDMKRAARELQASEERYRAVTELISDYAFSVRLQPDGTWESEWITADSFIRLTGYTFNEISGTLKLYHPDDVEAVQHQMDLVMKGQISSHECRIVTKDGQLRWLYIRRRPVWDAEQNRVIRYYGAAQDITERKRLQDLRLETEKLQTALDKELELSNLKSRMMERIMHEFRTPLTIVQASTESLVYYLDRLTPEQRVSKVSAIESHIRRLTVMLDQIGLVIEGKFTPDYVQRTDTNVSALCRQAAGEISRQFNRPDQFELDLPETLHAIVDAQLLYSLWSTFVAMRHFFHLRLHLS